VALLAAVARQRDREAFSLLYKRHKTSSSVSLTGS
jgi:hypothetical protein